ncbi:MAG: PDDEXK nuclease domain-containing protein [Candidatus Saccharibacteria bacterium]|nr:PDDEXK nuclease domain-containing protein [Candidatus Saccharibacteria bacterium]
MPRRNIVLQKKEYATFLTEIKERIRSSQYEAMKAVNQQTIALYWEIGRKINEKRESSGWGKSVVENLSKDIQKAFPGIQGFGTSNLWYMAQWYAEYYGNEILQPLVGEISWSKHIVILTKCKDTQERRFYIQATQKFGWTKDVLIHKIELKTFEKVLLGQTNFETTLTEKVKNQAVLAIQDEYNLSYTGLDVDHSEEDLEISIIKNIRAFLMDFGSDMSFIANQYRLVVGETEYFVDLMLYHRRLRSLIAIELKIGEFKPEYKGKMEFYLNVLNDTVKMPDENPSIGIIICKSKDRTTVDYALRSSNMPIGVATYSLTSELPEQYREVLPEGDEIARKLDFLFPKTM